ncbi:RPE-retinal G protein-coupled receptor isoform X4 [Pipistrellus kuhlii]|uniref:RPE-retinal G protein-coupled receptor isoform X4 n=1 Tax=Pipistrellus kuhlii TaxID=59472 RepID=UPI001E2743DD|nr:RPE-retinal G protein-coupled receptor isoform X4 [Pipistrellus kuhlii]
MSSLFDRGVLLTVMKAPDHTETFVPAVGLSLSLHPTPHPPQGPHRKQRSYQLHLRSWANIKEGACMLLLGRCGCRGQGRSLCPCLRRRWPYGSGGCQAHGFQGFAAALASICSSAAVAWGRYHHYCTRSRLAWSTAGSLVLFVWLSSAFWAALPLLGWGHYDYEPLGTCCSLGYPRGDRNSTSFLFIMAFFNFLLPLFITLTSYRLMEQKLRRTGPPQVPALIAKMVPTVNAVNYALGSGIWQCLSLQRSGWDSAQRAARVLR